MKLHDKKNFEIIFEVSSEVFEQFLERIKIKTATGKLISVIFSSMPQKANVLEY